MAIALTYNRTMAVQYCYRHVFAPNPQYANMDTAGGGGDCTNFTSQCMLAGGWNMDYRYSGYDAEWWYRRIGAEPFDQGQDDWWSCTWSLPSLLQRYLAFNGGIGLDLFNYPRLAGRLRLGDVIFYDWDGDGLFDHSAMVTRRRQGVPYVTYRTLSPLSPIEDGHWQLRFRRNARNIIGMLLPDELPFYQTAPDWSRLPPCDRRRIA